MFEIDKLKKEIEWMRSADLTLIDFEEYKITELIQALEEAKDLLETFQGEYGNCPTTFYNDPNGEITIDKWISRYFTRKEG